MFIRYNESIWHSLSNTPMRPEGLSFSNIFKYFKIKIKHVILTGISLDLSPSKENRS